MADLALQLRTVGGSTLTLDLLDEIQREQPERVYGLGNPPPLESVTETWVVRGRYTATTIAALWDDLETLYAALEVRSGSSAINLARVVRDPSGAAVVERTLGGSGWQEFVISNVRHDPEDVDALRAGDLRTSVRVELTLSATKVFADSDSIVSFSQTRSTTFEAGLATIEQETEIQTAESTDAVAIAKSLGVLPIGDYGATYWFDTDGDDGVDVLELDPDHRTTALGSAEQASARTVTLVRVVSRIRQSGVQLGGQQRAGASLREPKFSITTETSEDGVTRTTYFASARGQGRQSFVNSKIPQNANTVRKVDDQADRLYEITATFTSQQDAERYEIAISVQGGAKRAQLTPISSAHLPRKVIGPLLPLRLTLVIRREFGGSQADATRGRLKLPAILPDPWLLRPDESQEDPLPRRILNAQGQLRWVRQASIVYEAPGRDSVDLSQVRALLLENEPTEEGYLL